MLYKFRAFQLPGKTRWQGRLYCVRSVHHNRLWLQAAAFQSDEILPTKPKPDEREQWSNIKALLLDETFWKDTAALEALLQPFLAVTLALERTRPQLSHVYADFNWLKVQSFTNDLVEPRQLATLVQNRWNKLYHPLMTIPFLADPQERAKRPEVKVTDVQLKGLLPFLFQYCLKDREVTGRLYAKLHTLKAVDINRYLKEDFHWIASKHMEPIQWWQSMWMERDPVLAELCMLALSISPTTGDAERNWSAHGFIHNLRRNRLGHATVDKLVYLFWNLRIRLTTSEEDEEIEDDEVIEPITKEEEFSPDEGQIAYMDPMEAVDPPTFEELLDFETS